MPDKKDNKAFEFMIAEADKTNVDLFAEESKGYETKDIHTALMAAGFAPGIGNIADMADAMLYAMEGEFGEAAISAAAMIPIAGQMVAGRRALKAAKEAGEETITFYRGVDKWHKGSMVKSGKHVGGGDYGVGFEKGSSSISDVDKNALWVTTDKKIADKYSSAGHLNIEGDVGIRAQQGWMLEYEVPKSYLKKLEVEKIGRWHIGSSSTNTWNEEARVFTEGLDKGFLKKVHKPQQSLTRNGKVVNLTDDPEWTRKALSELDKFAEDVSTWGFEYERNAKRLAKFSSKLKQQMRGGK